MSSYDFAPLFRTAIGFDRLAKQISTASQATALGNSYPPYNIEKTGDDSYRLTMAVAGFGRDEIELTVADNNLSVIGKTGAVAKRTEVLYRGIAGRPFERTFALADRIVVEEAALENGLLHVALKRVTPEALRPRRIHVSQQSVANDSATSATDKVA